MNKEYRLYNVLFPVWMLIWFPSFLWLILIPANWLIDYLVLKYSFRRLGAEDASEKAKRHSVKICLAGFLSDFAGAALLFAVVLSEPLFHSEFWNQLAFGLTWNPFSCFQSFLVTCLAILLAGFLIYRLDRFILRKDISLSEEQIHGTAVRLAVITAPYLFLIPASVLYTLSGTV